MGRSRRKISLRPVETAPGELVTLEDDERAPLICHNPKDRRKLVGLTFLYLGVCTMLPWNFLISVTSFWNYKFRDITYLAGNNSNLTEPSDPPDFKPTHMQLVFPSYLAIASNIPGAFTTLIHSIFGQRIGVESRINYSLILLFVVFSSLLLTSIPNSDLWQEKFLHLVIMLVVLLNIGVNVLQGSLFGISGRFPPLYAGMVMTGQSFGGVVPSVTTIVLGLFDVSPSVLGPVCFAAILVFLVIGILIFKWMVRNPFFLFHGEGFTNPNNIHRDDGVHEPIDFAKVFKRGWMYFTIGFIIYSSTLCIFPALTSLVISVTTDKSSAWFRNFSPLTVLIFSLGDLLGRSAATVFQWPGRSIAGQVSVFVFVVIRTIVTIPMFMLCNAAPENRTLPVLIDSDVGFCLLTVVLAATGGYVGNLCLIQAPKTSVDPVSQEATSLILTSFFVVGQASGSSLSYFVTSNI